jgi:UDP-N-acetylmuramoylalanine--D-glutamate ligase
VSEKLPGGSRYSVLGGARSGLAVARLLADRGASVFVSDSAPEEKMRSAAIVLDAIGVAHEFGANSRRVLEADTIVVSPGVPSDAPLVKEALAMGIGVVSELEVASWFCPAPVVAITGTNGKTTTTVLTGRMFADARMSLAVAGNIGTAFSEVVGTLKKDSLAVLEVSSFQLDYIRAFRPRVAAILNITPDHLDRYEHSFEKYRASKERIFMNQGTGDVLIYNDDDEVTRAAVMRDAPAAVQLLPFSTRRVLNRGAYLSAGGVLTVVAGAKSHNVIAAAEISIRGEHNLANAMAASLAAVVMGVPPASVRATLRNFKGVEHRLEFVRELDSVMYVNDSKATNVDSVWYALRSFDRPLIVLMGGRDKGNDYARLREPVKEHVRAVIAIGESAGKVRSAFGGIVPVETAATMEGAVSAARGLAHVGDVVLLSPACASFDWFENYEHRGRVFKDVVRSLASGA